VRTRLTKRRGAPADGECRSGVVDTRRPPLRPRDASRLRPDTLRSHGAIGLAGGARGGVTGAIDTMVRVAARERIEQCRRQIANEVGAGRSA